MKKQKPVWGRMILAILAIILLLILLVAMGRGLLGLLRTVKGTGDSDPQFAEEAATVTMPPDLFDENGDLIAVDHSAEWDTSVQTPVDKTAEELAQDQAAQ